MLKIETAVISVSDKSGIVEFAKYLASKGVRIISTGGTAKSLAEAGLSVISIREITKNDMDDYFDGRMKTISFQYESALLYRRDDAKHVAQAAELGIEKIDMVVCNLYPFEKATAALDVSVDTAIDNIDIGGPCMIRAAAKNHSGIAVIVNPNTYPAIIAEMEASAGCISPETRRSLAVQAFERTADYDAAIHTFFSARFDNKLTRRLKFTSGEQLGRYAENWHQKGWLYRDENLHEPNLPNATQVHGGPLGYNNYLDGEAALNCALEMAAVPAVCIIKHANPCGFATGDTIEEALERAWQSDPVSAYGGIIALTRNLTSEVARFLENRFVELIIAPAIEPAALEYIQSLGKKKAGLRLLEYGKLPDDSPAATRLRFITGGLLEQEKDDLFYLADNPCKLISPASEHTCPNSGKKLMVGVATKAQPAPGRAHLYDFALRHLKHVKSNAITIAREYAPGKFQIFGIGCGQPNRKDSVALCGMRATENFQREYFDSLKVAGSRDEYLATLDEPARADYFKAESDYITAGLTADNVVLSSDAFFPFRDGLDNAATTGVKYILQPGGSIRDDQVIAAADEQGIAMIFTGVRKFNH